MTSGLFDQRGNRKYRVARETLAFIVAARQEDNSSAAFCLTIAITGARISEVLALKPDHIDVANEALVFRTLKGKTKVRSVQFQFQYA